MFCHPFGTLTVRTELTVDEPDKLVILAWNPGSTLYPEFLPRWNGEYAEPDEHGDREKIYVFDIPNCRSGWYIRDRINRRST